MKTTLVWVLAGLSASVLAATSFGESNRETAANPPPPADAPATAHGGSETFGARTDPTIMEAPPPKLRAETKPPAPGPLYFWVAGYYMPVKGQWTWVSGKWSMPPTVESVWIMGTYDAATKHWSEGHWQPDGKPTPKTEPNEKGPAGK